VRAQLNFLYGIRATVAPLSRSAIRASRPEWPQVPHSSIPNGRFGAPSQWTPLLSFRNFKQSTSKCKRPTMNQDSIQQGQRHLF